MKASAPMKRVVAIVGRPNVGKSAIFNRLAGRRVAIVHAESGVTRDRLMQESEWRGERFELVDTGGVCPLSGRESQDHIETGIRTQVAAALQDAAVAVFVVDVQEGLHPVDRGVAEQLRVSAGRVVVAANKADIEAQDPRAAEFHALGFPVFPVSALHNRGFNDLMAEVVADLPEVEPEQAGPALKVAVVGRPNVGKSSYINRLLRNERVIVSDVPGTTRDSIVIPFTVGESTSARRYNLIDTAGIRRRGKIDSVVERFSRSRAEDTIQRADVVVLVLDASVGPTAQDKRIGALIGKHAKGCIILANKWDLQSITQRRYGPLVLASLPFLGHCPLVFASAETGYNIRRSVDAIDHVASQIRAELPTGILNRVLLDACESVHAPTVRGKRLHVFYATQVGAAPIRIRIFVNDPRIVREPYRRYIVGMLRRRFGLEGAPVQLQFRARRPPRRTGQKRSKA